MQKVKGREIGNTFINAKGHAYSDFILNPRLISVTERLIIEDIKIDIITGKIMLKYLDGSFLSIPC